MTARSSSSDVLGCALAAAGCAGCAGSCASLGFSCYVCLIATCGAALRKCCDRRTDACVSACEG